MDASHGAGGAVRTFTHRHHARWQRDLTRAIRHLGVDATRERLHAYLAWPASRLRDYLHALEADGTVTSAVVYAVPSVREREREVVLAVARETHYDTNATP